MKRGGCKFGGSKTGAVLCSNKGGGVAVVSQLRRTQGRRVSAPPPGSCYTVLLLVSQLFHEHIAKFCVYSRAHEAMFGYKELSGKVLNAFGRLKNIAWPKSLILLQGIAVRDPRYTGSELPRVSRVLELKSDMPGAVTSGTAADPGMRVSAYIYVSVCV